MGARLRAVVDTNILIDVLNSVRAAIEEIDHYETVGISVVTWIETLVGCRSEEEIETARDVMSQLDVLGVPEAIAMRAVQVRQVRRLKLPDAIVLATAMEWGCQLVTRNTKDFPAGDPDIRVPYTLERETLERETLERETL